MLQKSNGLFAPLSEKMNIPLREIVTGQMRLYDQLNRRLYVNAEEQKRFLNAARKADLPVKALCLTLLYSGCRLSEGLALTPASIDIHSRLIAFHTLKKRNVHEVREVPVPQILIKTLTEVINSLASSQTSEEDTLKPLFHYAGNQINRITGYRWIKSVFEDAEIYGAQASPKGLRHGYGVHALRTGVPLNMLRKWMGHASIETTAIYANAVGKEEMEIAMRMWKR